MRPLALALTLGAVARAGAADHWAVLVAGSNSFWNYRHQADVCHAYKLLTTRGFDPEKIITMVYDDAANDDENPFKGKLYNYPWKTMEEAVDVREGCKMDYKGKDITPDKFIAVLTGDAETAGGPVLKSKEGDHVFVNFVDHGGTALIAFPDDQPVLHSKRLIAALKDMYAKKMYGQLTFYLETCESGSMFEGLLPESLPVYALTAANAEESSWGTYCGSDSKVGGKEVGSCLGDLFSVNWMMDSDKHLDVQESLSEQFKRVKQLTNKSHVKQYGQASKFGQEFLSDFMGPGKSGGLLREDAPNMDAKPAVHVNSRNAKLDYLYLKYARSGSSADGELLVAEIRARESVKKMASSLQGSVPGNGANAEAGVLWTNELLACHELAVDHFGKSCGWNEGRLVLAKTLYDLCSRTNGDTAPVLAALSDACGPTSHQAEAVVV